MNNLSPELKKAFYKLSTQKKAEFFKNIAGAAGGRNEALRDFIVIDTSKHEIIKSKTIVCHIPGGKCAGFDYSYESVLDYLKNETAPDAEFINEIYRA